MTTIAPSRQTEIAAAEASVFLRVLAHPARLKIVCHLAEGEASVSALETALGLPQPGLSQQIATLRASGLIAARRAGKQVFYRLSDARARPFVAAIRALFGGPGH